MTGLRCDRGGARRRPSLVVRRGQISDDGLTGLDDPFMVDGYVRVPDQPGLAVELNDEAIQEHLRLWSSLFAPTDEWNQPKLDWWISKEE